MQFLAMSIVLVASVQCIPTNITTKRQLPAPKFNLELLDPPGVIIKWERVKEDVEPVLGYKVRIWDAVETTIYRFKTVNGKKVLVEETEKPKLNYTTNDDKFHEYLLTGAYHTQLIIKHVDLDTAYKFQVLAFGASGDGEPSSQLGFQLHSD